MLNFQELYESDGLHRRIIKHNYNLSSFSADNQYILTSFLPLSGGSVNFFSATTISGGTIYSGSTNLYDIFAPISFTGTIGSSIFIQNGINTYTGGTNIYPTINITSATLFDLYTSGTSAAFQFSATTISGDTIYSGSTDLYAIFSFPDVIDGGTY